VEPDLVLSSFVQYDTESQNIGTNTRLRWTIKPGNRFIRGVERGWQRIVTDPHVSIVRKAIDCDQTAMDVSPLGAFG